MRVKCFCPTHGKLKFDSIIVRDKVACCRKCGRALEFGDLKLEKVKAR